jgi:hypothetical protein
MTNKVQERLTGLQLKQPSGIAISSGDLIIFSQGTKTLVGVANASQPASGTQPYDSNSGYFSIDTEGVFNFTVKAQVSSSPSAGAAIKPGDAIFADGGTFDSITGVTYGSTLDKDSNGTFVGLSLDSLSAGSTGTIRVALKGGIN